MQTETDPQARRAVIVVSSHVVRGTVGNRAAVFALETLGHPVWAVPTVILPWHPGHGRATRIVPQDFAALMNDLAGAPWLGEVGAVLSGYLGEASQAAGVASLVAAVRARNPGALYVCDPVIGDAGGLYVPEATAAAIRDTLMPLADVATPNRFELEWLLGREAGDLAALVALAAEARPARVLVTSAYPMLAGGTGNLLVTPTQALLAEHRLVERPPNGVGDLTAALFLARQMHGEPDEKALLSTTAAVYEVLARAVKRGGDELQLEADAASLSRPMALVRTRRLAHPARDRRS